MPLLAAVSQPAVSAPAALPAQASLVKVQARMAQEEMDRVGGGVVVAPGLVATNLHVVAGSGTILVGHAGALWRATGIQVDPDLDLCLLTVPGLPLPPAVRGGEVPAPGQPVFALGFPGGRGPVTTRGHLRAVWCYRDGHLLQTDAETHPGSSGGGLFDAKGRLLGLTTFTAARSPRLSFAISLANLKALEAQPMLPPGRSVRARVVEAGDYLSVLAEDPRNADVLEPAARAWVASEPKSPEAWFALGLALDRAGRRGIQTGGGGSEGVQAAVEAYRQALRLRPDARIWNNLGVALDAQNRFGEAEHAFGEAVKLRPDYALAWLNLGSTRLNGGSFRGAEAAFQRGLSLRPDDAEAWVRLAECQRKQKAWQAELDTLNVALRYRPLVPELWLNWGAAHAHLGHRAEAEAALEKLEGWDPTLAERLRKVMERSFPRRKGGGDPDGSPPPAFPFQGRRLEGS